MTLLQDAQRRQACIDAGLKRETAQEAVEEGKALGVGR